MGGGGGPLVGGKGDMACSCLLDDLGSDKGCFLCGGGVSTVEDCSCEFLFYHTPFCCDGDVV